MGNDYYRASDLLDSVYGLHQFFFPLVVKIGIGLIQYHQLGVTVNRSRQPDSLPLTAR